MEARTASDLCSEARTTSRACPLLRGLHPIIVATENGALGQQQTPFPALSFGDGLIAAVEARADLAAAGTRTDPRGKRTTVFIRKSADPGDSSPK